MKTIFKKIISMLLVVSSIILIASEAKFNFQKRLIHTVDLKNCCLLYNREVVISVSNNKKQKRPWEALFSQGLIPILF